MIDEPVEEVRAARRNIAEECGYDLEKQLARYERMQAEHPDVGLHALGICGRWSK